MLVNLVAFDILEASKSCPKNGQESIIKKAINQRQKSP
jgi:hypothetical protein